MAAEREAWGGEDAEEDEEDRGLVQRFADLKYSFVPTPSPEDGWGVEELRAVAPPLGVAGAL